MSKLLGILFCCCVLVLVGVTFYTTSANSGSVVVCPALPNDVEEVISIVNNSNGLQIAYIDNDGNPVMVQYSGTKFERMFVYKFRNAK